MKFRMIALSVALVGGLAACENLSPEQERAAVGGGVGAAGGALLGGVLADEPLTGALVGGAAGAATGALTERCEVPGEGLITDCP